MMNIYAAKLAADILRESSLGDPIGRQHVIDQLDAISSGRWIMVPFDSNEKNTEEARRHISYIYHILSRPDPTCEEYRGAISAAKAYIEDTCKFVLET